MPLKLVPPRQGRNRFWRVRGTHRGIHVDRSTKALERAAAQRWLNKWRDEIDAAALGAGTAKPLASPTFLDAAVSYMEAGFPARFLEKPVNALGHLTLDAITQGAIDAAASASYPDAKPATRNRQFYTPVSAVMRHAGHAMALRRPKGAQGDRRTQWLTPPQATALVAAARAKDGELAALITLVLYTGLRRSEAFALQWTDVDLAEGWARIPKTKSGRPRMAYLPDPARAALAAIKGDTGRVFRFRANGHFAAQMRKLRTALPEDLQFVSLHILRHTWATWMRRYGGADSRTLIATDAWSSLSAVMRYEHVATSEAARLADHLPDITRAKPVRKSGKAA